MNSHLQPGDLSGRFHSMGSHLTSMKSLGTCHSELGTSESEESNNAISSAFRITFGTLL